MMNSNAIGNVELKVTLSKQNITNEAFKIFKDYQKEVDKNTITYKIAGDKSSLESMLKEIQGFTPEMLTKLKLDFDKSDYDKEMNLLKNASGKTAAQIGNDFKDSIIDSLKGFNISEIIGKDLGKNGKITTKDIPKLKEALQGLMSQTNNFDLSKATSVKEINEQVIALSKMKVILEALSKYSDQKAIKIDGKNLNIAEMLKNNTSQIDSIMNNVGGVIKTNASQWATTLETTFNNEFANIISLFNHLQDIINGTFNSGSGSMFGQATKDMKNLQVEIDKTTKEIEELENKLAELQTKNKPKIESPEKLNDLRRGITNFANYNNVYLDKDNKRYNEETVEKFKQVVNEYMSLGGKLEDVENKLANKFIKQFNIQQILPPIPENISQEIARITSELELLKNKRDELILQQQNLPKEVSGTGVTGQGVGSGTGGQGTPTNATVSPTLSPTFKEDLQKLVDATGSVNATVSGKLSETFLTDLQTNADGLGNVKVGVDFGKKDGTQSQEIPVDVVATPKLSETFKDDLQKVIDETGKYTITIGTSENQQTNLIPIKASVENGEEFRDQLKQTVEGTDGLNIKVKPVIDTDFKLEINNAVLKDVKVEGTIQGGNLKPDFVETPTKTHSTPDQSLVGEVPVAPVEAVKEGLEEVKHGHEEAGKAAEKSGNQQSSSILKVIKEITQLRKEQEEARKIADMPIDNKDLLDHYYSKRTKYNNLDKDALANEINNHYNEINRDAGESNIQKIWTTIIALVDRYKKVTGTAFNFSNENAQNELLERRKSIYEKLQKAQERCNEVNNVKNKELTLSHNLSDKTVELGNLSKTTSEVEKLESKLFELIESVEKLKASSKTGLINIDAKKNEELKIFFEKWKEYKALGGTGNISDFTNEAKVINTVNKEYNSYIENIKAAKAEQEKQAAAEAKTLEGKVKGVKDILTKQFPEVDLTQFNAVFDEILNKKKTWRDALEEIRTSITATQEAAQKPIVNPENEKPLKLDGKGEINVVPKVEDPVGFANQVTEQLKGQSAKIDIKPNIIWDNTITSNSQDAIKNKEIDSKINSYNRMIELMNEYIKLQKTIAQGNKDIVETYDNGRFFKVNSSDTTRATDYIKPTKASLKRRLDSYLNAEKNEFGIYNEKTIANEKEKLASYVAAFNNADEAQKIFGRNNKALFTEIQTMIENAKVSLDAYQTSQAKLSGALHNAYDISTKDSWTLSERDKFESILNTGNIEKAVQYLQKHLGLQIPKAAQQAKTAIDGIGEQIQQEGQESKSKPIQIPISLEANIESLNTSLQSKKDQILPVDVKINAVPITNTSTNVGTTGMTYEAEQAETLRNKIVEVTTAVDNKTNAFRQEEQVVNGTVQSEITMLEVLDGQLNIILQDIQRIIDKPLKVNVDYSSIEQLSQADENGKSSIDKLKASIDGLQTGVLSDLGKAFSGLQLPNGVSGKIGNLAKALEALKKSLSNIDSGTIGFLDSVKDLAIKAEGLKDLATVIRASKEEIQKAKEEIKSNSTSDGQKIINIPKGSEEWDRIKTKALEYKEVLGDIQKITYSMRQDKDGKQLKSYLVTGSKSSVTLGENLNKVAQKETQEYRKTAEELNKIRNDFISAANKSNISFDLSSLKVDKNGIITFTQTVEKAGQEAVTTKYQIKDLYETLEKGVRNNGQVALNKDGSLNKSYLNNSAQGSVTSKDLTGEYTTKDKEALITLIQQAIEWEERENEYIKERNRLIAEGKAQEKAYYDASNKERENYTKFWENSLLKQDQKSLDGRKEDLSSIYAQADENVKRENEYLKERNKLLSEGKAQEKAYYDAVNKERGNYIKFWEKSLLKQDQDSLKLRGIDTETLDTALQKTKASMDQIFAKKQDISGFQSAFDRAQKKIKELNDNLEQGKISNIQTGYTDKVNKIIADLNNVVGVTRPLGEDPNAIKNAESMMRQYANTINNGNVKIDDFNQKTGKMLVSFEKQKGVLQEIELSWNSVTGEISATPGKIKRTQSTLTTFIDGIKARFRSLIQYLSIFVSYYRIIGMIKNGINVVKELDTALTEMRKVSDETVQSLKKFQGASFDIARSVGTTAKQIQESTADFMRLGNP